MKNDDIKELVAFCFECGQRVPADAGGNILPHMTISGDPCERKEMDLTGFHNYMKSMIDEFTVYWLTSRYPKTLDLPEWEGHFEAYIDLKQQGSIS